MPCIPVSCCQNKQGNSWKIVDQTSLYSLFCRQVCDSCYVVPQIFTGGEVDRADTEPEDDISLISPTPPVDEALLSQTTAPEVAGGGGEAVTSLVTSPVTSLFIYEMSNGILTTKGFISTTPDDDQMIGRVFSLTFNTYNLMLIMVCPSCWFIQFE